MPKTNGMFELSNDVRVVIALARQVEPNAILERAAVAAKLGRRADDPKLNGIMASVRRSLLRDENIDFDTIPKVGWRRMVHGEVAPKVSESARKKINSHARKADRRISAALNSGKLTDAETSEAIQKRSLNRLFVEVTRPSTFSKLEAKTTVNGSTPVPTQKLIDAMKEVC